MPLQTRTQKLASRQARSQLQVRRGLDSALPCFAADKRKYRADLRICQPYQGVFFLKGESIHKYLRLNQLGVD